MRARILSASAGSGKTYRLAYKYVHDTIKHIHDKPYLYRAILAVTFTNKATEEMKQRILERLSELAINPDKSPYIDKLECDLALQRQDISIHARTILGRILHDYSHFSVLTIDKFFQRILRAFIKELCLDMNYTLEIDSTTLISQGTDALLDSINHDQNLQKWILAYARENLDQSKSWGELRKSMLALGKEIFKEHTKLALQHSTPKESLKEIIAQSEKLSVKAKQEWILRGERAVAIINTAGVETCDFNGKSRSFANIFTKVAAGEIVEPSATTRKMSQSEKGWVTNKNAAAEAIVPLLRPILEEICQLYDQHIELWSTLPLIKEKYRSYALLNDIHQAISHICQEEGTMLLSETKYLLAELITDNDTPFIYEKTGNRFERYMIDEFQDTSLREWNNFAPLLLNAISTAEDEAVFIVGDVKQSIYRWRGGDWRILKEMVQHRLGKDNIHTENLKANWRSLDQVVKFNNTAIGKVVTATNNQLNNELYQATQQGFLSDETYHQLHDTLIKAYEGYEQEAKSKNLAPGYVRVERYDEQPRIIDIINDVISRGYTYNDIMILHRNSDEVARTTTQLLEHKWLTNAPYNIKTQESLIIGNSAIASFIIALMRLSQNINDKISIAIVNRYLNRSYHSQLTPQERELLTAIGQLSPEEAFERIVIAFELDNRSEEIAYLQAVHEQVIAFCSSRIADIAILLKEWDEKLKDKSLYVEQNNSTIELITIHKAKGLEKKIIIIPYCNWGFASKKHNNIVWAQPNKEHKEQFEQIAYFPVRFSNQMSRSIFSDAYYIEHVFSHVEVTNILYVALTRAKEELYVCIPTRSREGYNTGQALWAAVGSTNSDAVEFGVRSNKQQTIGQDKATSIILSHYPTTNCSVSLRLPSQRYFESTEDSAPHDFASRDMGILMHSILCTAQSLEDIYLGIEDALLAGKIDQQQKAKLLAMIEQEFKCSQAKEWFNQQWDKILTERDIIYPEQNTIGLSRPDRVMIKGERAVVVDYKFGNTHHRAHHTQVRSYMELLRKMGYNHVEGYVWYMTLGDIQQVTQLD